MTDHNHAYVSRIFRQYASQAKGDAGNYWQSDDGAVEIVQTGEGFPTPVYDRVWGAGFLVQRTHAFRRRYSEEFVGHFKSLEAAIAAASEVKPT